MGIVPHHADTQLLKASAILPRGWAFIDPEGPVERVVTAIGSCELVVSSSLHGLITADSFGIPCIWARTVQPLYGATDFKFRDYATARRAPLNEQLSYRSVLSMSEGELSVRGTVAARELDQWQKELIDAFPEELRVKR